jgi:hypothetical protein
MFQFNSRARAFVAFCRLGLWSGSVALAAWYNDWAGEARCWPFLYRAVGREVHVKRLRLDNRSMARVRGVRDPSCRPWKNLDLSRDLLT